MPEGDTIFRTATVLRAVLMGRTIIAAKAQARPGMRNVSWRGQPTGAPPALSADAPYASTRWIWAPKATSFDSIRS